MQGKNVGLNCDECQKSFINKRQLWHVTKEITMEKIFSIVKYAIKHFVKPYARKPPETSSSVITAIKNLLLRMLIANIS